MSFFFFFIYYCINWLFCSEFLLRSIFCSPWEKSTKCIFEHIFCTWTPNEYILSTLPELIEFLYQNMVLFIQNIFHHHFVPIPKVRLFFIPLSCLLLWPDRCELLWIFTSMSNCSNDAVHEFIGQLNCNNFWLYYFPRWWTNFLRIHKWGNCSFVVMWKYFLLNIMFCRDCCIDLAC